MNTTQHPPSPASRAGNDLPTNLQAVLRAVRCCVNTNCPRFQVRARPSYALFLLQTIIVRSTLPSSTPREPVHTYHGLARSWCCSCRVCVCDLFLFDTSNAHLQFTPPIHRRFIYKGDTSTHAQGTGPRGLWEPKGSTGCRRPAQAEGGEHNYWGGGSILICCSRAIL